jgi:hypothetical protein
MNVNTFWGGALAVQLRLLAGIAVLCAANRVCAQNTPPTITLQPAAKAVSLGANVSFTVSAKGTTPVSFQWQFRDSDLAGATNALLSLTNVQFNQAGDYQVRITNVAGVTISAAANLSVSPAFFKVTSGPVSNASGGTGGAWADFNNDGNLDLFVSSGSGSPSVLYTNNGMGGLVNDVLAGVGSGTGSSWGSAWADYDNDGHPDLMGSVYGGSNYLFHNNGDGTLRKVAGSQLASVGTGNNVVWGDYDNDGFVDAFFAGANNLLFHNEGDGTFTKVTNSIVMKDGSGQGCAWGDYDNDGFLDLFVTRVNQPNLLFHNNRDGTFAKISSPPFSTDIAISQGCSWGDYDNDGNLDLVVCNVGARNFLYHNAGGGHFEKVTNSIIGTVVANSSGSAWADYDNDGYLDLFIAVRGGMNLLFHNNGDGTFTRVTASSLISDSGTWIGAAWGDFNNDGFPDLFVGNLQGNNALYINAGNSNNWITITCEGRLSNRSAIGAKVRLKATIHGKETWQLREVSGGGGLASQNDPRAQFGLGDATNADLIRVEWPSGIVQELTNVAPKQLVVIREPSRLKAELLPGTDLLRFTLAGGKGIPYSVETSADLNSWVVFSFRTNQTGTDVWTNQLSSQDPFRWYRGRE